MLAEEGGAGWRRRKLAGGGGSWRLAEEGAGGGAATGGGAPLSLSLNRIDSPLWQVPLPLPSLIYLALAPNFPPIPSISSFPSRQSKFPARPPFFPARPVDGVQNRSRRRFGRQGDDSGRLGDACGRLWPESKATATLSHPGPLRRLGDAFKTML